MKLDIETKFILTFATPIIVFGLSMKTIEIIQYSLGHNHSFILLPIGVVCLAVMGCSIFKYWNKLPRNFG